MPMVGGKNLDLIQILMSMVQCHVKEHLSSIECRKHVAWVGCHGFGLMNTRMNEKDYPKNTRKIKYFSKWVYVYALAIFTPMPVPGFCS